LARTLENETASHINREYVSGKKLLARDGGFCIVTRLEHLLGHRKENKNGTES
jgi:hypothetical protein